MTSIEQQLADELGTRVIRCYDVDWHHPSHRDTIRIGTKNERGQWQPVLEEGDFIHWQLWRKCCELLQREQWIPVSERLPDEKHDVWVVVTHEGDRFPMQARLQGRDWVSDGESGEWPLAEYDMTVTHWAEIIIPKLTTPPETGD